MHTYSIDDGSGQQITTGLNEHVARRTAQRLADERGESVYLYTGEGESEEFSPAFAGVRADRVYLTTAAIGQSFGTVGQVRRHHPGCHDHGEVLCETDTKPYGFSAAALNAATDIASDRGWVVVDEDYEP